MIITSGNVLSSSGVHCTLCCFCRLSLQETVYITDVGFLNMFRGRMSLFRGLHLMSRSERRRTFFFLSIDTESINFDHHLRCDGWLNFEFSYGRMRTTLLMSFLQMTRRRTQTFSRLSRGTNPIPLAPDASTLTPLSYHASMSGIKLDSE